MRKLWLRGMLLGVSLSLLLAGGAALAQDMSIEADRECFECEPGRVVRESAGSLPENVVEFMVEVRDSPSQLCFDFWVDQDYQGDWCHPSQTYFYMYAWCGEEVVFSGHPPIVGDEDVGASHASFPFEYGEWMVEVCEPTNPADVNALQACAETTVTLAEVCEAEFVPEPGTVMLLGSGLVGLAGYATLRWRTRE